MTDPHAEPTSATLHETPTSSPPALRLPPPRRDPAEVAGEEFAEWWETHRTMANERKLFENISYEAHYHDTMAKLLWRKRIDLLVAWRHDGLNIDDICERTGLSYTRVRDLLPPELRPRRRAAS